MISRASLYFIATRCCYENVPCLKSSSLWFEPAGTARATFLPSLFRFNYAYLICLYPAPSAWYAGKTVDASTTTSIHSLLISGSYRDDFSDLNRKIINGDLINAGKVNNRPPIFIMLNFTRVCKKFYHSPNFFPLGFGIFLSSYSSGMGKRETDSERDRERERRFSPRMEQIYLQNSRYTQFYSRHLAQIAPVSVVH